MIVIDEMHHLGSDKYSEIGLDDNDRKSQFLPNMFSPFLYRLGLGATPWSEYDERNQMIIENFVNTELEIDNLGKNWKEKLIENNDVFYFGLEDGIKGILCEFDYIPLDYTPKGKKRKFLTFKTHAFQDGDDTSRQSV